MNKDEYIIINKTAIQKRIEDLFTEATELLEEEDLGWQDEFLDYKNFSPNFEEYSDNSKYFYIIMGKIESLQDILSQSIPLIPEIEKAFGLGAANNAIGEPSLSDYISNLKLDI